MKKHGGKRANAGRPTECEESVRRIQLTLDESTIKTISELGLGNISLGVREAARLIRHAKLTRS